MPRVKELTVRLLRGSAAFDAYASKPDSAFGRAADLRLANDSAFLGAMADGQSQLDAQFLIVELEGEPCAVVPAFRERQRRQGLEYEVWGTPPSLRLDLSDLLVLPTAEALGGARVILNVVRSHAGSDALYFTRVPERSHLERLIRASDWRVTRIDSGRNAWCDVTAPEALGTLSKHQWRNIERLERRAERNFGSVGHESLASPADIAEAFNRFLAIENSGWKGQQGTGTSLLHDPPLREFLRRATVRLAVRGNARVDILTLGGQDAAAQLAFRTGDTWYLQKIGYAPNFRDVGPGAILLRYFLERMATDPNIREVNFMTDPQWAERWHFRSEPCHTVVIHGSTWRGRTLLVHDRVRDFARKVRDRLANVSTPSVP